MLARPPKPVSMTLNLAPMVDVMMCLIIFFLLGSALVIVEGRPVELPYARSAQQFEAGEPGARVVVNVRRTEDPAHPAQFIVAGFDGKQATELVLTPELLTRHLESAAAAARERGEEVRCVIRADRELEWRHVEVALRACGTARIGRVLFSANSGPDPGEIP